MFISCSAVDMGTRSATTRSAPVQAFASPPPPAPRRFRDPGQVPLWLRLSALFVALLCLLPVLYLVLRGAEIGSDLWSILFRGRTARIFLNSVLLTLTVTASATAIGVLLAWLTVRTDLPHRRFWSILTCLPIVLPSYVGAFALIATLGPNGALQHLLSVWGVTQLPSIYGFFGAWLALTLFTYPYVQLSVRAGLRGLDPSMEEAARSLGRSNLSAFRRVTLPHLQPAIVAGALLVALYTLSDFGAVSLLQFDAFTRAIYVHYTGALDRSAAAILALLLVVLTLGILTMEYRLRGRSRYYRVSAGAARRQQPMPLGVWKVPALMFCGLLVFLALGIPLLVTGYWLIQDGASVNVLRETVTITLNSVAAAGLASAACVLAALPIVVYAVRFPDRHSRWMERCVYIAHGLPGIVVALALVFFGIRFVPALYQTWAMLILAYVILFIPLALGNLRATLMQISPRIEEASRMLGKSARSTLSQITVPLLRPGLLAGLALVFLTCMKELPATLILGPTGFPTLATRIWSATEEAYFARAAAPALILVAVSAISMWIILRQEERVS